VDKQKLARGFNLALRLLLLLKKTSAAQCAALGFLIKNLGLRIARSKRNAPFVKKINKKKQVCCYGKIVLTLLPLGLRHKEALQGGKK